MSNAPADLFTVLDPIGRRRPVVASLPHSGLRIPEQLASAYRPDVRASLPNTDWYLRELYDFLPALGVTVLQANYSRYVVDLNRSPDGPQRGSFWTSVIPEVTAFGTTVYDRSPSERDVEARVADFHTPYHDRLEQLLTLCVAMHGRALLLDLHSFMGPIDDDVCLGDRNGECCSEGTTARFEASFRARGFRTVRNKVFAGGHITRRHGALEGVQALQIELRYTNYLPRDQLDFDAVPKPDERLLRTAGRRLEAVLRECLPPWAR